MPRVGRWQWILCGIVTIKGENEEENVVRWGGGKEVDHHQHGGIALRDPGFVTTVIFYFFAILHGQVV